MRLAGEEASASIALVVPSDEPLELPRLVPLRHAGGSMVEAVLQRADDLLVRKVVSTWVPLLQRMRAKDAGWPWERKAREVCYLVDVEHVMITQGDDIQGILVTSLPPAPPPLSAVQSVVFIEWVATAPWNRPEATGGRRCKGIGSLFLQHVADRSRRAGRRGCIGLVSEPDAEAFYVAAGLCRCGMDPGEGLEYFEGDAGWAESLLVRR
jgi:hypothetical protein